MKIRRALALLTAPLLIVGLGACGAPGSGDHRDVAQDAISALADGDVEGLCDLFASSETGPATDIQKSVCQDSLTSDLADLGQSDLDSIGELRVDTVTLTQGDEDLVRVEVDDYEETDAAVVPTMELQRFEGRWYLTDLTV